MTSAEITTAAAAHTDASTRQPITSVIAAPVAQVSTHGPPLPGSSPPTVNACPAYVVPCTHGATKPAAISTTGAHMLVTLIDVSLLARSPHVQSARRMFAPRGRPVRSGHARSAALHRLPRGERAAGPRPVRAAGRLRAR